ncbi:unannotated protein [freshwater metagenome]|uniref:Unannotated protein n=1 Tax=freshwater metagenome TaxID=449393 RepID=A0A6J6QKP3_9ZZZZ
METGTANDVIGINGLTVSKVDFASFHAHDLSVAFNLEGSCFDLVEESI